MTLFRHNGLSLGWKSVGNGEPIVWVHGFLENSGVWDHIIPHFVKNFRCILIDLPGHGSTPSEKQHSLVEVAILVKKLLDTIHCFNPVFIGHSMGGYVGLELKKIIPIKLILLHSNFWEDSAEKKENRNRVIEAIQKHKNQFIAAAIPNLFYADNITKNAATVEKLVYNAQEMTAQEIINSTIAMRDRSSNYFGLNDVSIIHGDQDPIISSNLLEQEINLITEKPVVHNIPECGHMSMFENPEALINILASILIP